MDSRGSAQANMADQELSKDQWSEVFEQFAQMVESREPYRIIERQNNLTLRRALENLWRQHERAERMRFLEDQITMVSELRAQAPAVFHSGQLLADRFAILRTLGQGGMGEVYLAEDKRLSENVALKTIKRDLAKNRDNMKRFLEEVTNSRRVTHPNVCRIFDLFEHDGVPFFSMEYIAGPTLAEVLSAGPLNSQRARHIAIQTAEGLWTAHSNKILHCDFKPANIILSGSGKNERAVITDFGLARALRAADDPAAQGVLAGTPSFMGPELLNGQAAPSVRTDIFSFGKVLELLMPGSKLAALCSEEDAERRPESLEEVLRALRGDSTRRKWIGGLVLGAAGSAAYLYEESRKPKIALTSKQRVRVNGFTPETETRAKIVRNLLVMALRQSPLLSVLGDRPYSADGLKPVKAGFALPLVDLLTTAREEKANLVVDGKLTPWRGGLQLTVSVYDPAESRPRYQLVKQVSDGRSVVQLADLAADDLRTSAFGESAQHSSYRSLEQITSSSPEAVDCFFRAVFFFEKSDASSALQLLNQAVAIDPNFTLAHHYRALTLTSSALLETALAAEERAFSLQDRVTDRERNWIQSQYYNITRDFTRSAAAMQKNTLLYPDEAIFQRQLAYALVRLGRYDEAFPYNRRAIELDPFSDNNRSELVINLAEANRMDKCFDEVQKMQAAGRLPSMIHRDLSLAYLQKDDYPQALQEAHSFGLESAERDTASRLISLPPLIVSGRFAEAIELIQGDLALDAARPEPDREQTDSYIRRNSLGQLYRLNDRAGLAAEQADYLVGLHPIACNLIPIREGCALALDLNELSIAKRGLDSLYAIVRKWPSTHSQGAVALTHARLLEAEGQGGAADLYSKAKGLWPDPINLFYVSQWEGRSGLTQAQFETLTRMEGLRGTIYKHHFGGLVVLGWLEQAKCLEKLALFEESLRMYDRVLQRWRAPQVTGSFLRQARSEMEALKRRIP